MRAAVMRHRALVVAEVPAPKPGDVVMGHEFCAQIVEHGPETTKALKAGTRVCSRPTLLLEVLPPRRPPPGSSISSWPRRRAVPALVGVCMEADTTPDEFAATLRHIAEGALPAAPLITGHVGLHGVAQAFVDLGFPERHAKILVHPGR